MNLDAPELNLSIEEIKSRLAEGVDISSVLSVFNLPKTDSVSEKSVNLLPKNLSTSDEDGNITSLPKSILDSSVERNVNGMRTELENTIKNAIDRAVSIEGQLELVREKETLDKLSDDIRQKVDSITSKTQNFIIALNSFYKDNIVISNYKRVVERVIQSNVDKLTNKDIRDITNNENFYNDIKNEILSEVVLSLILTVKDEVKKFTQPNSSVVSSVNTSLLNSKEDAFSMDCYIRVYYTFGEGADPDTFDGMTVMNTKLISGRTCAVDNSIILLNSKIIMPDGREFLAMDTFIGSTVRPAVYLYFNTREEAASYLKSINATLDGRLNISVVPPKKPDQAKLKPTNITIRGISKKLV